MPDGRLGPDEVYWSCEKGLEDDMRVHSGQLHSLQESRRGFTPSPAWDQAIVLSNRGPVSQERGTDGSLRSRRSSGGLVTALEPLVQACAGTWVSCGTQACETAIDAESVFDVRCATSRYRLRHVGLSAGDYRGYYYGFANEGLWPLCHSVRVQPVFRPSDFLAYRSANRRFAAAVADEATCPAPLLLVQDYHFGLAPRELRYRLPAATIVSFWHIPWPPPHVLRVCPWAREMVDGLLASDIAGFQTPGDCTNFINAAERMLGANVDPSSGTVRYRGRQTRVGAYPVGVEWNNEIVRATPEAAVCHERVRRELGLAANVMLGVGVDRLDYTKGINEKFLAIERLLEQRPVLRSRFVFVQVAEPSRECLSEYRSAREQIVATARRVNERFGNESHRPILLRESHHAPEEVYRLYRAADVCHVGSLRDGMNLVAKEFVCARDDEHGVLVLSDRTGAALQLRDALLINPWSIESSASALWKALTMADTEQVNRMRRLRLSVADADAGCWARRLLADAESMRSTGCMVETRLPVTQLSA
jgi:trehalose 6-phosphate synthase